eukprot:7347367-Pyramimonas_sp.AAC.1
MGMMRLEERATGADRTRAGWSARQTQLTSTVANMGRRCKVGGGKEGEGQAKAAADLRGTDRVRR